MFNLGGLLKEKLGMAQSKPVSAARPVSKKPPGPQNGSGSVLGSGGVLTRPKTDYTSLVQNRKPMLQAIAEEPGRHPSDKVADLTGYINDKTYGSVLRASKMLTDGIRNIPTRIGEALDPNDDESRGDQLLNETAQNYKFTPQFRSQVHSSNPMLVDDIKSKSTDLVSGSGPGGIRKNTGLHRVEVKKSSPRQNQRTMLHEGLHDSYDTLKEDSRSLYDTLLNQALQASKDELGPKRQLTPTSFEQDVTKPGLKTYLDSRTRGYGSNRVSDFSDIKYIHPGLRNELHSYVPEYYESQKMEMPSYLKDYYANYYDTGGKATPIKHMNGFEQLIRRVWGE